MSTRNRLARTTAHMFGKPWQARAVLESREAQLVERDRRKPGQGHLQGVMMEDGDANERQAKQDEIDRDPEKQNGFGCHGYERTPQWWETVGNSDETTSLRRGQELSAP